MLRIKRDSLEKGGKEYLGFIQTEELDDESYLVKSASVSWKFFGLIQVYLSKAVARS